MSKYDQREYRIGDYWLSRRAESPAYYRCWLDGRSVRRASLGTTEFEVARQRLEEWYVQHRRVEHEKPADASLADILRRYWEGHAKHIPSHSWNKSAFRLWLDHWGEATVGDLTIPRQEAFHTALRERGQKNSTILRVVTFGQAALSRAIKRGELQAMPYIVKVKAGAAEPKGRPLEIPELQTLYRAAPPHVQAFIRWGLGTAARPAAIIGLHSKQVDWERGVIDLNPQGREQNKKHRPIVRLPKALQTPFDGFLVSVDGRPVASIKTAWNASVRRGQLTGNVTGYSLRHTAARWMRMQGVPVDEVRQQLGHRVEGITGVYTGYDPRYLENACAALNKLVLAICSPVARLNFS